jgi:hypothetical protein
LIRDLHPLRSPKRNIWILMRVMKLFYQNLNIKK